LAVTELSSLLRDQRRDGGKAVVATGQSLNKPAGETPGADRRQSAQKGDKTGPNMSLYVARTKPSSP
jgi:hypothetical protein